MVGVGVGEAMMGVELAGYYGVCSTLVRTPTMGRPVPLGDVAVGTGQPALKERCFSVSPLFPLNIDVDSYALRGRTTRSRTGFPKGITTGGADVDLFPISGGS